MTANGFFDSPILNSPYQRPVRHWHLDENGQPTQRIIEARRSAEFVTPIPKAKKQKAQARQAEIAFKDEHGLSSTDQQYETTRIINEVRKQVDDWRTWPKPSDWQVTPVTARLLEHWRHHPFNNLRPFFCQVEAAETAIWLTEVAPKSSKGREILNILNTASENANPGLSRLALKLATGAGKTTVMAMLIAWQTLNAQKTSSKNSPAAF